jgi:hypothetical protein
MDYIRDVPVDDSPESTSASSDVESMGSRLAASSGAVLVSVRALNIGRLSVRSRSVSSIEEGMSL